ncbi:MAG: hypothetical protein JW934_24665, partial [Anaerolineae bacterium]|nr:hypothetical protein [Anaerolineae bacterium]
VIGQLGSNARAGNGPHFVIEADEYDHMFLGLKPTVAVVTHLEHDHPDCFPTFADTQRAFECFLNLVPSGGLILGCGDQPNVAELLKKEYAAPVQTGGLNPGNDWQAQNVRPNALGGHSFAVVREGQVWGEIDLQVPGIHNVQNALLALAVADWAGVPRADIVRGLASFAGTERRFEVVGEAKGITVIDDYGHHPTKIAATLAGARARYGARAGAHDRSRPGGRALWAVFQPHTYSRTKTLWAEFLACFAQADHVIVLDIYAARERDALGISAEQFINDLVRVHPDARHIGDFEQAAQYIVEHVESNAVVITLSAGDGNQVGMLVLDGLRKSIAAQPVLECGQDKRPSNPENLGNPVEK